MLDLKEMEKMLDEALAKETKESLTNWILNKRKKSIENFLTKKYFTAMNKDNSKFENSENLSSVVVSKNDNYNLAA